VPCNLRIGDQTLKTVFTNFQALEYDLDQASHVMAARLATAATVLVTALLARRKTLKFKGPVGPAGQVSTGDASLPTASLPTSPTSADGKASASFFTKKPSLVQIDAPDKKWVEQAVALASHHQPFLVDLAERAAPAAQQMVDSLYNQLAASLQDRHLLLADFLHE